MAPASTKEALLGEFEETASGFFASLSLDAPQPPAQVVHAIELPTAAEATPSFPTLDFDALPPAPNNTIAPPSPVAFAAARAPVALPEPPAPPPAPPPPKASTSGLRPLPVAAEPVFAPLPEEVPEEAPRFPLVWRTIVVTAALALALSILPLPSWARPFPALRETPKATITALLWPKKAAAPAVQPPPPELAAIELPPADEPEMGMDLTGPGNDTTPTDAPKTVTARPAVKMRDDEARKWDVLLSRVGGKHVDVVDPCLDEKCSRTALAAWFHTLDAIDQNKGGPARIVVIGTSLIASDHITDVFRRRAQKRHGDSGLGFMFTDRPTRGAGRTVRTGIASEGWKIEKITDSSKFAQAGLSGAAFTAPSNASQEATFTPDGSNQVELYAIAQSEPGSVQVIADGTPVKTLEIKGAAGTPVYPSVEIPAGTKSLTIKTKQAVRLDGVVLEKKQPGVVLDSLGLPGATATVLLTEDEALFTQQMKQRAPALVVLMIGGNDAFDMSRNRYTADEGRNRMATLIKRVKAAAPDASCLLASPPDAGVWTMAQTIVPRAQTKLVTAYMGALAKELGCGWYDMQAAMGGEGAIERWWSAGLMNRDLVHPLALGGDIMGYQIEEALDRARLAAGKKKGGGRRAPSRRPRHGQNGPPLSRPAVAGIGISELKRPEFVEAPEAVDAGFVDNRPSLVIEFDAGLPTIVESFLEPLPPAPGFLLDEDRLVRLFAKLRVLEREKQGRVAIMQIGASHTAAHFFTDHSREVLSARFGGAGRGYIAAGSSSPRLLQSGVSRSLSGSWLVKDALKQKTRGSVWGLTGVRAEGLPGAKFSVSFEDPTATADDMARIQVSYFATVGGALPLISVDQQPARIVTEPVEHSGPRVLEFAAPGARHTIQVVNPGPDVLSLFGVSQELLRPGIVYDAIGLPGSTSITLASYDQQALIYQLKARQPDLFILFYGTNESALAAPKIEEMRESYAKVFETLHAAAPNADCVIFGPTDRMSFSKKTRAWHEALSNTEVTITMREVAREYGCAFWQTRAAMGGAGGMQRWLDQKLGNKDHVHLTNEGYDHLADLAMDDLLHAYDEWRRAHP